MENIISKDRLKTRERAVKETERAMLNSCAKKRPDGRKFEFDGIVSIDKILDEKTGKFKETFHATAKDKKDSTTKIGLKIIVEY